MIVIGNPGSWLVVVPEEEGRVKAVPRKTTTPSPFLASTT
jgi:hypothetical protein